jgi:hypothetical protein
MQCNYICLHCGYLHIRAIKLRCLWCRDSSSCYALCDYNIKETAFFVVTAVKTSNLTFLSYIRINIEHIYFPFHSSSLFCLLSFHVFFLFDSFKWADCVCFGAMHVCECWRVTVARRRPPGAFAAVEFRTLRMQTSWLGRDPPSRTSSCSHAQTDKTTVQLLGCYAGCHSRRSSLRAFGKIV